MKKNQDPSDLIFLKKIEKSKKKLKKKSGPIEQRPLQPVAATGAALLVLQPPRAVGLFHQASRRPAPDKDPNFILHKEKYSPNKNQNNHNILYVHIL